jgi:hypothetical protein
MATPKRHASAAVFARGAAHAALMCFSTGPAEDQSRGGATRLRIPLAWRCGTGRAGTATTRRRRPVRFRRHHSLRPAPWPTGRGGPRRRQRGASIPTREAAGPRSSAGFSPVRRARRRSGWRRSVTGRGRAASPGPRACAGGHVGLTARGAGRALSLLSRGCSRSPTKRLPGQARPESHPPAASSWPYDEIDPAPQPPGRRNFPGAAPSGARLPRETNFPARAVLRAAPARVEGDAGAGARRLAVTGRRRRGDRLPGTRTHKETTTWPASANS